MSPTPNQMAPKIDRTNPLHLSLLSNLLATKPVSWIRKTLVPNPKDAEKPLVVETKITGSELRYPLARNVSELSVDRAARKWAA